MPCAGRVPVGKLSRVSPGFGRRYRARLVERNELSLCLPAALRIEFHAFCRKFSRAPVTSSKGLRPHPAYDIPCVRFTSLVYMSRSFHRLTAPPEAQHCSSGLPRLSATAPRTWPGMAQRIAAAFGNSTEDLARYGDLASSAP